MNVIGSELVQEELAQQGYYLKAIFNDSAVAFFPGKTEHRTVKVAGLSYEDDYGGNALASVITDGRFEIRNHKDYSSERVKTIIAKLFQYSELQILKSLSVTYHGQALF